MSSRGDEVSASAAPPRLAPQPWLEAGSTRAVIAALTADGATVRFVGGCVRDALLGRAVKDIDIATRDPPARVIERLEGAGIKAIPTGIAHGTVTAVIAHEHFEITTLRIDVETDGRRAKVAFTDDWTADAARRDFTINALSLDPDGALHDPFGGIADLQAGRVRFVGDARARLREDVLRLLRYFRFHAHYGRGEPDAEALASCTEMAPLLPTLSGERIAGELLKLMLAPDPAPTLALMRERRVLAPILPEMCRVETLAAMVAIEAEEGRAADALRRLASLIEADAAAITRIGERLKLSNRQRERLLAMVAPAHDLDPAMDTRALRRVLRRLGPEDYVDRALICWARARGAATREAPALDAAYRAVIAAARDSVPPFPLKGRDALALGIAKGPVVGALLAQVETWWEEGDYRASRAECLARLRAIAKAR